jgi:hypothetical protein
MSDSVGPADSAGVPWSGRHFEHGQSSNDDGSAPAALIDVLTRFRAGHAGEADVVAELRGSRLLIPLIARLEEAATNQVGQTVDKSAELAIVTVTGPDGRNVLPAFTSVDSMRRWNAKARPVPADAVRIALAAVSENTELVVLDPGSETEFVIRRPALWAIGQSRTWSPSYLDPEVQHAFEALRDARVHTLSLASGDPRARLAGPELLVQLTLEPGLTKDDLDHLLASLAERWATDEIITTRVDSLGVKVVAAE